MNNCFGSGGGTDERAAGGTLSLPREGWLGTARDRQSGDSKGLPAWGPPGHAAGHRHAGQQPPAGGGRRLCRASSSSIVSHAQKPLPSPAADVGSQPASFCACFFFFSQLPGQEKRINKYTHIHTHTHIYIKKSVCIYYPRQIRI